MPRLAEYPDGTIRMWMGEGRHFLVFPVRAWQLLNCVGFVPTGRDGFAGHLTYQRRTPAIRYKW